MDDAADVRLMLRMVLEGDERFEVVGEGKNGREAIDTARRAEPDVLILDLMMPVMDGIEALPELRRIRPDLRVIAYSGQAPDIGERAIEACADVFVEKGISPFELLDLIRSAYDASPKSIGVRVSRS